MQDCFTQLYELKHLEQRTKSIKPKVPKTRNRIQKRRFITAILLITSLLVIGYGIAS